MKLHSLTPIVTGAGLCLLALNCDLSAQRPPVGKPAPPSLDLASELPDPQLAPPPNTPTPPPPAKAADRIGERDRRGPGRAPVPYGIPKTPGLKIETIEDEGGDVFAYDAGRKALPRVTIVSDNSLDPMKRGEIEEDFAVMSRIFQKELRTELGRNFEQQAMGIVLDSTPPGRTSTALYLQGYGALFTLTVNFPITATDEKHEVEPQDAPLTAWEKARQELHAPRDRHGSRIWLLRKETKRIKYDERRVDSLKDALFESLRNANNLRHLAPNDWVVAMVLGNDGSAGPGAYAIADGRFDLHLGNEVGDNPPPGNPGSGHVLTIRIKKSDLDALAAEKGSSRDDLRKRAQITTY